MTQIGKFVVLFLLVLLGLLGPLSSKGQVSVSGIVNTLQEDPICDVIVRLLDENGQTVDQVMTTTMGTFSFTDLPLNSIISLQLEKEENPVNGISAFDQVLILRSILGIGTLDLYQSQAADVDDSGSVSVLDIIHIRRLILVLTEELPGPSWLFGLVDLPVGTDLINLGEVTENLNLDILGLKRADVNYSAVPCY